jgi:hypothetical protein
MGSDYANNEAFFAAIRALTDAWCERRSLHALAILLPAYTSLNGLTDGWQDLLLALKRLNVAQSGILPSEHEVIANLMKAVERALRV